MEKITFEDLPSTRTPLNAENLNKIQDSIETEINEINEKFLNIYEKNEYSTEEQRIGIWIDGKPLYRKSIMKTINSSVSADLGSISDIDYINVVDGCTKFTSGSNSYYVPTSTYETSNNYSKLFIQKNNSTNIATIKWTGNSTTGTIYATVEYTKTTD